MNCEKNRSIWLAYDLIWLFWLMKLPRIAEISKHPNVPGLFYKLVRLRLFLSYCIVDKLLCSLQKLFFDFFEIAHNSLLYRFGSGNFTLILNCLFQNPSGKTETSVLAVTNTRLLRATPTTFKLENALNTYDHSYTMKCCDVTWNYLDFVQSIGTDVINLNFLELKSFLNQLSFKPIQMLMTTKTDYELNSLESGVQDHSLRMNLNSSQQKQAWNAKYPFRICVFLFLYVHNNF